MSAEGEVELELRANEGISQPKRLELQSTFRVAMHWMRYLSLYMTTGELSLNMCSPRKVITLCNVASCRLSSVISASELRALH